MLLTEKDTAALKPLVILLGSDSGGWRNQAVRELAPMAGGIIAPDHRLSPIDQAREWSLVVDRIDLALYWLDQGQAEDELQLGIALGRRTPIIVGLNEVIGKTREIPDLLYLLGRSAGSPLRVAIGLQDMIVMAKNFLRGALHQ
jgi:hypothetical protein